MRELVLRLQFKRKVSNPEFTDRVLQTKKIKKEFCDSARLRGKWWVASQAARQERLLGIYVAYGDKDQLTLKHECVYKGP